MQVLITVKASPQPSAGYGDTVCVAGVEIKNGKPVRWVRLYPVPFRYLEGEQQFKKYQIIEVAVTRNQRDPRPESYKIDASSIRIKESIEKWPARVPLVQSMVAGSMCGVLDAVRQDANAPSLALIEPRKVLGLRIEPHPGWSAKQAAVLDQWVAQPELFGGGAPKRAIKAPRFSVKYRYICSEKSCNSHEQGLLDWELTALQLKLAHQTDEQLEAAIEEKFYRLMCAPGRSTAFFVGNQAEPTKRRTFSVLGVYYPKVADAAVMRLF